MIGRTLSHYRIVARLGAGGMGSVYRAEDTLLGRAVALKFPHRGLVPDANARRRFLVNARPSLELKHSNIVRLHDVCDVDGLVFVVMELIEGHSLQTRLASGPVPLRESLTIARAVADALAYAHGMSLLHLDLKPDNVLISSGRTVKVADFCMPRVTIDQDVDMFDGTPAYLAPEMVRGDVLAPATDLYGLGILLYEMVTGAPPFRESTMAGALFRVLEEPAPALPAAVPGALQSLVERLLAKNPADRPGSAAAVAEMLVGMGAAPA